MNIPSEINTVLISGLSTLITALIGVLIRYIEKAPLDKRIKELETKQNETNV